MILSVSARFNNKLLENKLFVDGRFNPVENFEAIGDFLCRLFGVEPLGDFFYLFGLVEIDDCVLRTAIFVSIAS